MPNHIKNRIVVNSRAEEVFALLKGEDTVMDFNKIIPMPESLDILDSSLGDEGMKYLILRATLASFRRHELIGIESRLKAHNQFDEAIDLGKKYLINIANYGYKTWYEWACENWGTKWNAYNTVKVSENCVEYETAWAGVVSLIEKLSMRFPDVVFEYKYSDEDTGSNCGHGTIANGVSSMIYPEDQSREAYELAFDLRPENAEYYRLEDGNYIYFED